MVAGLTGASYGTSIASQLAELIPEAVDVPGDDAPVRKIDPVQLQSLGQKLNMLFTQYVSDRRIAELRWLRNQRQYLGIYDPDIEKELSVNRSKAYPRITRVKCISVLARLMNLMFPGNEKNWELKADPSPSLGKADIQEVVQDAQKADQEAGQQSTMDLGWFIGALKTFTEKRAKVLSDLISDQLQELGGNQTSDYVQLNRKVVQSGILYGIGILKGPYTRTKKKTTWSIGSNGQPQPTSKDIFMPLFEFMPVWDFYPDMSAKTFVEMDGHFEREVMSRAQVRKLANRPDFMKDQILKYLRANQMGNYRPQPFETELRAMGVKVNVNELKVETSKYEMIIWKGQTSGTFLQMAGIPIAEDKVADDMDAEIWMIDGNVVKAEINPWVELGEDVKMIHVFIFDEDDTSPIGFGLPNAIRDSQMAISAATRMLLDNASVVCGPNLELNTDLLRADQDLGSTSAYKIWYRTGDGVEAQWPAVRNVEIDSHLPELQAIIKLFMDFCDAETFVGPATGGDMSQAPSEPMRTAAGASMLRGDAALPFKDIVRHFDAFTMSVILSMVLFNRKFNPDSAKEGDYDVIARGATSLIAKEIRGMQIDQLVQTLTPGEQIHVDARKLAEARFKVRDLDDLLVTEEEAARRQTAKDQQDQQDADQQKQMIEANIRKLLSDAFKNITQAQKNTALADASNVEVALDLLQRGLENALNGPQATTETSGDGGAQDAVPDQGNPGDGGGAATAQDQAGADPGGAGGMPAPEGGSAPGGMPSV